MPIVNRPRTRRRRTAPPRLGRSELAAVLPLSDAACKVATDMMISGEYHAMPRRYALGFDKEDFVDAQGNTLTPWEAVAGVLNLRDTVTLLEELEECGVAFRSATEPFDTSTPIGRMLAMFAQFERHLIVGRVTSDMERRAEQGKWKGGPPPPGYDVDPQTDKLVINEAEAILVRLIFGLYTKDRLRSKTISHTLHERGHRNTQRSLREREAELAEELESEPVMPDAASLNEVQQHITEVLNAGNPNQRKALVETFVVKIKITGPGRMTPVIPHKPKGRNPAFTGIRP
ncbi:recombinase family protein [Saccharothrix obliqua]|uniref:recombinase family protein n=1 Tax=Saccharothrix obliqua TaxID=2861747 RepID=UPI0027E363A3|nr:recombinase family protein [Saccharothrix obliqua]